MARRGGTLPRPSAVGVAALIGVTVAAVGPGTLLAAFAQQQPHRGAPTLILGMVPDGGGSEVRVGWTPRTQRVVDEVGRRWPAVSCGGQADGTHSGHIPGSDHYTGNAADCTAGRYGVRASGHAKAVNDAVAAWAVANAAQLHVKYVIWYGRINELDGRGWQRYCDQLDPSCADVTYDHYDHVHISEEH